MKQAAMQLPDTKGGNEMASKIINIAIAIAAVALVVTGGILAYLHFQPSDRPASAIDRTLQQWQEAVEKEPGNALARANLGATYLDMGDYDNAVKELRLALDQEPENFPYMFKLGFAYRGAGNMQAAVEQFQGSADRLPAGEKYASLFEIANTYMMMGDAVSAKDYVQQSIDDKDSMWNTHYLLGQILEKEGDTEGAKAQYDIAAKYNPGDAGLQDALARVSG
jgi:tetratricopeptide (TPR) repeat protein